MSKSATLTNRFALLVIILAVLSCDSITETDTVTPEKFTQSDYYILPGTSAIIDLESVLDKSFLNGTLSVSENPTRGTLSYATTSMLKYIPGREFQEGEDRFVLSVVNDGKILAKGTMTIKMKKSKEEFPCALVPVEDKIKIKTGSKSVSTNILDNDWFCNIDKSNVSISIQTQPKFGHTIVDGESIIYTADAEYKGYDQFIYKLTSSSNETTAYAIITVSNAIFSVPAWTAKYIPVTTNSLNAMDFIDENIGYLASSTAIFKTSDGGEHWSEVLNLANLGDAGTYFVDINFLSASEGFAIYETWSGLGYPEKGGLASTKDGGISWKFIPIKNWKMSLTSVFFISATVGFIGGCVQGDGLKSAILKTEDSGETWKLVLVDHYREWGDFGLKVKFADSNTGYAYQMGRILITRDGGESWKTFASYEHIPSMAIITKDIVFAGATVTGSFTHPSSILKFQGESTPKQVAYIQYKIWQLEFSPSGNVGFAVGINDTFNKSGTRSLTLCINRSIDKGETWTEEYIGEYKYIEELSTEYPKAIAVPSGNVVYILYAGDLIKYSNH